ncbi:condensation domain-containing protein [Micromonospora sp. CA-249363]|uniref:condensation domain-containing protein n=1 Tax=Micromonospora sp. CA-249363 TaxID=3239963 RepID=UPI003D938C79
MTRASRSDEAPSNTAPLSAGQQSLWFLDRLHRGSAEYHIPEAYRLFGKLNELALEQAVNALVRRHEMLRTRYRVVDGHPVQETMPHTHLPIRVEDISGLVPALREQRVSNALLGEWHQPFDLSAGAMLRCRLLRLSPEEHVLVLTVHHIASDGWSQAILRDEMSRLYAAFHAGLPDPLPAPAARYSDYVRYQTAGHADSVGYWVKQLAGLPDVLTLPTARPRTARVAAPGGVVRIPLPSAVTVRLKELGAADGTTLYMALLALFAALLTRHSGQEDIAIGTPVADRPRVEFEKLVGFLVNTLVVRVGVQTGEALCDLVARVRRTVLDAQRHRDAPIDQVVEAVSPSRRVDVTPLFQVMFALQAVSDRPLSLTGLRVEALEIPGIRARFDLELHVLESPTTVTLVWVYDDTLFDRDRIELMAADYVDLATRYVEQPTSRVEAPTLPQAPPVAATTVEAPGHSAVRAAGSVEEIQQVVGRLFGEVLGLAGIGPDDNFFALGGHSLTALSLAEKLTKTLGVEIDVREIFAAPTVAEMVALLSRRPS